MAIDVRRLELERVENLVRNFGWVPQEVKHPPGEIILTISKKIEEPGGTTATTPSPTL